MAGCFDDSAHDGWLESQIEDEEQGEEERPMTKSEYQAWMDGTD